MTENQKKPSIEEELLSSEAHPAEETNQYGDETDTPALPKKHTKKNTSNIKKKHMPLIRFSETKSKKHKSVFDWLSHTETRHRSVSILGHELTFWPIFIVIVLAVFASAVVLDNSSVEVDTETVTIVGLPTDLEGYTMLVISDLNGKRFGDEQSALLRQINNTSYDCVILLGDMVGKDGDPEPLYELLEGLGTKKPVYFICGDNDPGPYVSSARNITGTLPEMLFADWILGAIERGATYVDAPTKVTYKHSSFWLSPATLLNINAVSNLELFENLEAQETDGVLAGLSSDYAAIPYTSYRKKIAQKLADAVSEMSPTDVHISLAHEVPSDTLIDASCVHDVSDKTYLIEADLILAGHYCGGVMRLPFLGAFYINAPSSERYGWFPEAKDVSGLKTVAESQVYTTSGLSTNGDVPLMPFRLFNSPSISLITLTAKLEENKLG